ncbi:hypothetical protein [Paenibacillus sp. NFR01]|uniref:hypothetical protein n=1 Tax=Paenibacillus sp. NFR01 TaxID=1566279 RepID=UPI0008B08DD5|nr:hypothetical protein [Paenibacillus sp. NFR01]SES87965.1 hypothetical protein SAMN03159358_0188 [Paenibacillus sp. NFR01]
MINEVNKYLGSWMDHSRHLLIINMIDEMNVSVDFYPSVGSEPVVRKLLGRKALSKNMKGILQEQGLQIELGEEELGPTLQLKITHINIKEYLEPRVVMGMYDDYEDDFGVPWIYPLTYYKRL